MLKPLTLALLIFCLLPRWALAQDMSQTSDSMKGGSMQVTTRSFKFDHTPDGKLMATLLENGTAVKVFHNASDFSDDDRESFPDAYKMFTPGGLEALYEDRAVVSTKPQPQLTEEQAAALLQKDDPNGYSIYQNGVRETFQFFLSSAQPNSAFGEQLDTAVHETLHSLDHKLSSGDKRAYYLINGKTLTVPAQGTFNRSAVNDKLPTELKDFYARQYLVTTGAQGLPILLDELNAYAHGGNTELAIAEGTSELQKLNPGLQHMMLFVEYYLRIARTQHTEVEGVLAGDDFKQAILALWRQAEDVLERACDSDLMISDEAGYVPSEQKFLNAVYAPANIAELTKYFDGAETFERPSSCGTSTKSAALDYAHLADDPSDDAPPQAQPSPQPKVRGPALRQFPDAAVVVRFLTQKSCGPCLLLERELNSGYGISADASEKGVPQELEVDTPCGKKKAAFDFLFVDKDPSLGSFAVTDESGHYGTPQLQLWQKGQKVSVSSGYEPAAQLVAQVKALAADSCGK